MGFERFFGNRAVVNRLREAIRAGRMPPALILSGPKGAGKYTLALMLAKTMACRERPELDGLPDFCGHCANCTRIAISENLSERIEEAVAAREELRDADKRETRILIQSHPDVLVVPPDPPQLLIKIGQVRSVVERIHRFPAEAPVSTYIFTSSGFMKEAANSLLKVLEEPPDYAHIFLLTTNPGELLPTIRSRAGMDSLGALPAEEIGSFLAEHRPEWNPEQRALAARLSNGAIGQALSLNLEEYLRSRQDALLLLRSAAAGPRGEEIDFSSLFHMTETYKGGAAGREKTLALLRAASGLLEDLLVVHAGAGRMVRNIDLDRELERMAEGIDLEWIEATARGLAQVELGMRRNLLQSLSLDAFATGRMQRSL